jgi:hypothetical protein
MIISVREYLGVRAKSWRSIGSMGNLIATSANEFFGGTAQFASQGLVCLDYSVLIIKNTNEIMYCIKGLFPFLFCTGDPGLCIFTV